MEKSIESQKDGINLKLKRKLNERVNLGISELDKMGKAFRKALREFIKNQSLAHERKLRNLKGRVSNE